MLERDVIRKTLAETKKLGVPHIRMTFRPGVNVGVPDFIFLIPGGRPLFIEFKRLGGKPTARQQRKIDQLRELGYDVIVADTPTRALDAIDVAIENARRSQT